MTRRRTWYPDGTTSGQAHDAVLQSPNTRAAAFWASGNAQADKKHDSIDAAVDAVMAMLERMQRR